MLKRLAHVIPADLKVDAIKALRTYPSHRSLGRDIIAFCSDDVMRSEPKVSYCGVGAIAKHRGVNSAHFYLSPDRQVHNFLNEVHLRYEGERGHHPHSFEELALWIEESC